MDRQTADRPDLNNSDLIWLLGFAAVFFVLAVFIGRDALPGTPLNQGFAIIGTMFLLMPLIFFLVKRSGRSRNPPFWFVAHVLSSVLGCGLIFLHVAGGDWFSPPGLVLLALIFLVVQGLLARALLAQRLSHLFARSVSGFNFTNSHERRLSPRMMKDNAHSKSLQIDQVALQQVIDNKIDLLKKLDSSADEALFSPTLKHWFRSPLKSWRYQRLAAKEYRLVGARQRAGWLLAWWRYLHLLAAAVFFVGVLVHVTVVLFFAGYAAGDGDIYWWHFAAWGK